MKNYEVILCISDIHAPYNHKDLIPFLEHLKKNYLRGLPESNYRVVSLGDELDYHATSYHETDTRLPNADAELEAAIAKITPLYEMFPKMAVLESNHGSLNYRKAQTARIATRAIRPYRSIIRAPRGWRWYNDLFLRSGPNEVYFTHGKTGRPGALGHSENSCAVQGHFHEKYHVTYWRNRRGQLLWDAHL